MVHEHSPGFRKAILCCWAFSGILLGALVINPENWIQRFATFAVAGGPPVAPPSDLPKIVGAAVGGVCGLLFFLTGASFIIQSKREYRWLQGGVIAFAACVPATVLQYYLFPPRQPAAGVGFVRSFLVCIPWVAPGLVWGIGWGLLENVVCSSAMRRIRARYGRTDKTSERLPVVSRRLG